jgi:hypothetical protein
VRLLTMLEHLDGHPGGAVMTEEYDFFAPAVRRVQKNFVLQEVEAIVCYCARLL